MNAPRGRDVTLYSGAVPRRPESGGRRIVLVNPLSYLTIYLCYPIVCLLFWTPGVLLARLLIQRHPVLRRYRAPVAFVCSSLAGYAIFWVYLADWGVGLCVSLIVTVGSVLLWLRPTRTRAALLASSPVRLTLLIGLLYLSVHFLYGVESTWRLAWHRYFELVIPGDNQIPLQFANAIYTNNAVLHNRSMQGWTFADRPPLETGIVFLFWPLGRLFDQGIYYECLGTVVQLSWVTALASMAATLGFGPAKRKFILGATAFSGVVFFNTVYVWPKLLAGSLFLFCLLPVVCCVRQRRPLFPAEACLCAVAATLSYLAHSSAGFSLLALLALAPFTLWSSFSLLNGAWAIAVCIALYAPWFAYQKSVDSNLTQLAKLHLAGDLAVDARPLAEVIGSAYRKLSFAQWTRNRYENVRTLFGRPETDQLIAGVFRAWTQGADPGFHSIVTHGIDATKLSADASSLATVIRADQREYVLRGLGVLNVGWFVLIFHWLRPGRRPGPRGFGFLVTLTLLTALLWCTLEFLPASTITAHASYGMLLSCFFLTAASVWDAGPLIRNTVATVLVIANVTLWGCCGPGAALAEYSRYERPLKVLPAVVAAALAAAMIVILFRWPRWSALRLQRGASRAKALAGSR